MIKLEKRPRRTSPTVIAHERALTSVAFMHGALHVRRNVTRVRARVCRGGAWTVGRREFRLLELRNERITARSSTSAVSLEGS